MCFVGKATKIFIFLITVVVITGLVFGFGILRHTIHPKSHKCSDESCSQSHFYPPPLPEFPIPSIPDPNAINYPPPPPSSSGSSVDLSPPAAATSPPSPPPVSVVSKPPPPPSPPPVSVVSTPPPPPVTILSPPPPVVIEAQPPAFDPPSLVPVTPGPVKSL